MMPDFQKPLALLSILLAVGLGLMAMEAQRLETRIQLLKADHQAQINATEQEGKDRLIAANAKAEQLTTTLRTTEAELQEVKERKQHAIVQVATGRTCFNAELVRVLNSTDTRSEAARMPQTIPSLDATDGAIATDTDIATWIIHAQEQYETCRARYHALIDFNPSKPQITHD